MKVAGIHGIANRFEGRETLAAVWLPALNSGLREAGFSPIGEADFTQIFFGSIFRRTELRGGQAALISEDEDWIRRLLIEFNREAGRLARENRSGGDARGEDPDIQIFTFPNEGEVRMRGRAPQTLQALLRQVFRSRFFRALGPERMLLGDLREVRCYLHDRNIKAAILARFEACIEPETRVMVAHSLGSVVAYEALCLHPEWKIDTLVTLGSPLGIRNLVFDELTPKPIDGRGAWPNVARWVNIADKGDIVALEKRLSTLFGRVEDVPIHNGWASHDVRRYLTAKETGKAIGDALSK